MESVSLYKDFTKSLCKSYTHSFAQYFSGRGNVHTETDASSLCPCFEPTGRHVKCQTLPQANMSCLLLAQTGPGHCANCIHMTHGQLKTQTGRDHLCLYSTVRQHSQRVSPARTMLLQQVLLYCCSVNA